MEVSSTKLSQNSDKLWMRFTLKQNIPKWNDKQTTKQNKTKRLKAYQAQRDWFFFPWTWVGWFHERIFIPSCWFLTSNHVISHNVGFSSSIGNCRVAPSVCFNSRSSVKPLIWKWFFRFYGNEKHPCTWPRFENVIFWELGNGRSNANLLLQQTIGKMYRYYLNQSTWQCYSVYRLPLQESPRACTLTRHLKKGNTL